MDQYHVLKQGKPAGTMTRQEIAACLKKGTLRLDDFVKAPGSARWTKIGQVAVFVQVDALAPGLDEDDNLPQEQEPGHRLKPQSTQGSKGGGRSWRIPVIVGVVGLLMVATSLVGRAYLFGGWGAKLALTRELDNWRAGEASAAANPGYANRDTPRPILVTYEIVRVNEHGQGEFEIVTNLTFSTLIGGKPVNQHRFVLAKQDAVWGWTVTKPYIHYPQ